MPTGTEVEKLIVRLVGDGKDYQKMLKDAQKSTEQYARATNGRLRDAQGRFLTGQKKLNAELALASTRLQKAAIWADHYGTKLNKVGKSMQKAGRAMLLRVTAPLAIIGGLSVRAFSQFDQAMTESTSIMQVTEMQIKRMRDTAISLSGRAAQTPKELANSYFFLASAGKNAQQSMALLPKVARFATAGTFDMALATDLLTDAQSALGLSTKNVGQDTINLVRVSDVLVKANTLANASVQQFATALTSKAGAAMKSYNIDVEAGVAVLAALADQGIKAELAGNALDRVIRLLSKASRDNVKQFKKLGFSVFNIDGSMRNLADIIQNIEDITSSMSVEMKSATLEMLGFEARVQGVILPLLGTSNAIRKYEKGLRKAKGITQEVADKQMKSFSNQMKILKNQLTVVGIEIGEQLAPTIGELGKLVKSGVDSWRDFSSGTKGTFVALGLVLGVLGPLLIAVGSMIRLAGFAAVGFKTLAASAWAAKAAIAGVIGLGVAAFFIGVQRYLQKANDEFDKTLEKYKSLRDMRTEMLRGLPGKPEKKPKKETATEKAIREAQEPIKRRAGLLRQGAYLRTQVRDARRELDKARAKLDPMKQPMGAPRFNANLDRAAKFFFGIDPTAAARTVWKEAVRASEKFEKEFGPELRLPVPGAGKSSAEIGKIVRTARKEEDDAKRRKMWADRESVRQAQNTFHKISAAYQMWVRNFKRGTEEMGKKSREHWERMEKRARIAEKYFTPDERFKARKKELLQMLTAGEVDPKTFGRAMVAARAERKGGVSERSAYARVTAVKWGSLQHEALKAEYKAGAGVRGGAASPQQEAVNVLKDIKLGIDALVDKEGVVIEPADFKAG